MRKQWEKRRKRLYDIIEVGSDYDVYSRVYDFVNAGAIRKYAFFLTERKSTWTYRGHMHFEI